MNHLLNIKAKTPFDAVIVYNLLGQSVLEFNPKSIQASFNTSSLQAGMYLVKVKIGEQIAIYKIIKE